MNIDAASALSPRSQDFAALQSSLQAGNLVGAQQAFAAFQQDVQKTAQAAGPSNLFAPGTQASHDLQTLGGALRSANLSGAQKAFATLLQDIQTATGPSSTAAEVPRGPHRLTPAEIASNGVSTSTAAQSIGNILSGKV